MPSPAYVELLIRFFRHLTQRVLAFGSNILPLLAHNAAQEPASLENINHEGFSVAAMAAEGLESMMAMPQLKARFWRRWLEWTGT